MANVSNAPYPGEESSYPGHRGVLIRDNVAASEADIRRVVNQLAANSDSGLRRTINGIQRSDPRYDGTELYFYNAWHKSRGDRQEHCTLRLFNDTYDRPWNSTSYHVYRDGTVSSRAHGRPRWG